MADSFVKQWGESIYPGSGSYSKTLHILLKNGDLYGVGRNTEGLLAQGDNENRDEFVKIKSKFMGSDDNNFPIEETVANIVDASEGFFVLTEGKRLYAVGTLRNIGINYNGGTSLSNVNILNFATRVVERGSKPFVNVKMIKAFGDKVFVITEPGKLHVLGIQRKGELGLNNPKYRAENFIMPINTDVLIVKDVLCTGYSTYILTTNGEMYATGSGSDGQLGNGEIEQKNIFIRVNLVEQVSDWSISGNCIVVQTVLGRLYTFGHNISGQLGVGSKYNQINPQLVTIPNNEIVKEFYMTYGLIVLTQEGNVYSCGQNQLLGIGSNSGITMNLVKIPIGEFVEKLYLTQNSNNRIAKTVSGKFFAWCNNGAFSGVGVSTPILSPMQVQIPAGENIVKIFIEVGLTFFVTDTKKLYFSGANSRYASGIPFDSNLSVYNTLTLVETFDSEIEEIFYAVDLFFVSTKTKLYCWGTNTGKCFGDEGVIYRPKEITFAGSSGSGSGTVINGDFAIMYPNGGSEATPANVAPNQRYVEENPFAGFHVLCITEILHNGKWGDPGVANFLGVKASQLLPDDKIIVKTGNYAVSAASGASCNPHELVSDLAVPVPCRVKIVKLAPI